MVSKVFSLQGKGLKLNTRADIEPYLEQLKAIEGVEEVHFGGNTIGIEAAQALAEVLKTAKSLKVADLADIFTGRLITEIPPALQALCDALVDSESLVELNLSDNAFGGRSAEPMVNFLTNNRRFSILKLNNNGLGVSGGTTVANALLESARLSNAEGKPSNLRTVICGRNRLENGSAPFWAEALEAHGGLLEVRMPQNGIRMEGVEALAKGLSACKNLQVLDLQDNTFTERGSRAVALALPRWPSLHTLNISDCLLGPKGGIALGTVFVKGFNPLLEVLKLQYGEVDHRALNLLAAAIKDHWPALKTLELNGNRADPEDECITNIKEALASHGHEDALDELDDMEEYDEDAEEKEDVDEDEKSDEDEAVPKAKGDDAKPLKVDSSTQTEDTQKKSFDEAADALADLLSKTSLGPPNARE